jgi:hypothetical protein
MISHWTTESATPKDPGTLSAYHLCRGDIITKVQLRVWVWAPDGLGGYIPTLYQKRHDPIRNGYRGQAWIESPGQLEIIEEYVNLVNSKLIVTTGEIRLRHAGSWHEFRRHLDRAREVREEFNNAAYHLKTPHPFAMFKKSVAVDRCS